MTTTLHVVTPHFYEVREDGQRVGFTFSHPRCLPRSWSVKTADGTELRAWFRTRKAAAAYLVARAQECPACNAEANEDCRWGCPCRPETVFA